MHGYYDMFRKMVRKFVINQQEKGISKYLSFPLPASRTNKGVC